MLKNGRSVRAPIARSPGQEWQYEISTVRAHIGRSPGQEWQYEISTGRAPISGQEWQYEISTVRAHLVRSPGQEDMRFLLSVLIWQISIAICYC